MQRPPAVAVFRLVHCAAAGSCALSAPVVVLGAHAVYGQSSSELDTRAEVACAQAAAERTHRALDGSLHCGAGAVGVLVGDFNLRAGPRDHVWEAFREVGWKCAAPDLAEHSAATVIGARGSSMDSVWVRGNAIHSRRFVDRFDRVISDLSGHPASARRRFPWEIDLAGAPGSGDSTDDKKAGGLMGEEKDYEAVESSFTVASGAEPPSVAGCAASG